MARPGLASAARGSHRRRDPRQLSLSLSLSLYVYICIYIHIHIGRSASRLLLLAVMVHGHRQGQKRGMDKRGKSQTSKRSKRSKTICLFTVCVLLACRSAASPFCRRRRRRLQGDPGGSKVPVPARRSLKSRTRWTLICSSIRTWSQWGNLY